MYDDPDLEIPVHYRYRGHRYRGTKLNARICDQCHSKHRSCDRKSPSCSRCLKSKQQCTWKRPRVLRENVDFVVENYLLNTSTLRKPHSRPKLKKKVIHDDISTSFQLPITLKIEAKPTLALIKTPSNNSSFISIPELWKSIFNFWNRSTLLRYCFRILTNSSNVSLETSQKQNFRLIAKALVPQNLPLKRMKYLPLQLAFSDQEVSYLKSQAIKAYFYYFNPFFPLFTFTSFHQRPRSQFLKSVITCIGLKLIPRSDLRDQLITSLETEILFFKKLSNLTFNLDTLQALLCIYCGLAWSSVANMNYSCFLVAISIMYSIGLHHGKYQKDPTLFLERSLAFHVLYYHSTRFFNEGLSTFNLEEITNHNFSILFSKIYPCNDFSKISNIYKPLGDYQLEFSYLVITEQLHQSSIIFNEASKSIVRNQEDIFDVVFRAEKSILKVLKFGLKKLSSLMRLNSHILGNGLLSTKKNSDNFDNPAFFELIYTFRVRIFFDLLQLLDLIIRKDSSKLEKTKLLKLYKKIEEFSTIVIKGLGAINLHAPFVFFRPQMVLYSARMALQASRYCHNETLDQIIDLSLTILNSQSKTEIYSFTSTVTKNVLEALKNNMDTH